MPTWQARGSEFNPQYEKKKLTTFQQCLQYPPLKSGLAPSPKSNGSHRSVKLEMLLILYIIFCLLISHIDSARQESCLTQNSSLHQTHGQTHSFVCQDNIEIFDIEHLSQQNRATVGSICHKRSQETLVRALSLSNAAAAQGCMVVFTSSGSKHPGTLASHQN